MEKNENSGWIRSNAVVNKGKAPKISKSVWNDYQIWEVNCLWSKFADVWKMAYLV